MTQEEKLSKLGKAKRYLVDAEIAIHDAGVLHDDAMSISTNRFHKLREHVSDITALIEACEKDIRTEKPIETQSQADRNETHSK